MFTKAMVLASLTAVVAVPMSQESQGNACSSNGDTVYCCDSQTAKALTGNSLTSSPIHRQSLLGQCNSADIPIVGVAVPVKSQCSQQAVCCGEINQHVRGLITLFKLHGY